MKLDYLYEVLLFALLILLQVLLFNQISVFGLATPFLYIYFILKLPVGRNVFFVIIMGFLMGLIIDIFLNTPGINAAATTLVVLYGLEAFSLFNPQILLLRWVSSIVLTLILVFTLDGFMYKTFKADE